MKNAEQPCNANTEILTQQRQTFFKNQFPTQWSERASCALARSLLCEVCPDLLALTFRRRRLWRESWIFLITLAHAFRDELSMLSVHLPIPLHLLGMRRRTVGLFFRKLPCFILPVRPSVCWRIRRANGRGSGLLKSLLGATRSCAAKVESRFPPDGRLHAGSTRSWGGVAEDSTRVKMEMGGNVVRDSIQLLRGIGKVSSTGASHAAEAVLWRPPDPPAR